MAKHNVDKVVDMLMSDLRDYRRFLLDPAAETKSALILVSHGKVQRFWSRLDPCQVEASDDVDVDDGVLSRLAEEGDEFIHELCNGTPEIIDELIRREIADYLERVGEKIVKPDGDVTFAMLVITDGYLPSSLDFGWFNHETLEIIR